MSRNQPNAVPLQPGLPAAQGLPALTGVRALAAAMVYLHHYPPARETVGSFFFSFFGEMHSGVSVFFVLSGFLIYFRHSGADALHRVPLIRYGFHRFARIYPVYFLVVVAMAVWNRVYYFQTPSLADPISTLLLQLSFLRGFSNEYKFIGVGQGWTLTTEVTFYVLFPLLLVLIRRFGFLATLALTYAAGVVLCCLGRVAHYHGYFSPFQFVLIYTFFGRAGDFFAGMMLADYVRRTNAVEKRRAEPGTKWRAPVFTLLGGAGIAACLAALVMAKPSATVDGPFSRWGGVVYILLLPPFICSLFYGLIMERTWFSRLLGSRWLVIMGASSYCFYLIHVGGPHNRVNDWINDCGDLPGYAVLVVISVILWKYVEEPLRRRGLNHRIFRESPATEGNSRPNREPAAAAPDLGAAPVQSDP